MRAPSEAGRLHERAQRANRLAQCSGASWRHGAKRRAGMSTSDPTAFGRIDEDGTVYLKTAAGERAVGSWQAGTPEEGLAHFARRFADLLTEVELLETRLANGSADAGHTLTPVRRLPAGIGEGPVVGDLDTLTARLEPLAPTAREK